MARALVGRRLAACVTRLPLAVSVYAWRGNVEEAAEVQLLMKTTEARVSDLKSAILELHPYEEPEVLVIAIDDGSAGYLGWLKTELER